MELLIEQLLLKFECQIEESIFYEDSFVQFWHSAVIDKNGNPISGGFSFDKMQARKIALAEFIERKKVNELFSISDRSKKIWGFDLIPTACGFAAGFNLQNTIQRSINEAVERWVMSKWIDDGYQIEQMNQSDIKGLDPASEFFISQFDEVLFFKKEVAIQTNDQFQKITVGQTMGLTEFGIFPGSSAQFSHGQVWQHALLESYRHFLGVKNNPDFSTFPGNKVLFFARNKQIALDQINKATKEIWPTPEIILHQNQSFASDSYFLARTIISGWQSWNLGPIERFLY